MEITAELFWRWALLLSGAAAENNRQTHSVEVIPTPCCAVQYINDTQCLSGSQKVESVEGWGRERQMYSLIVQL